MQLNGCDCMMGGTAERRLSGMAGNPLEDSIANYVNTYVNDAVFGTKDKVIDNASPAVKSKQEFYANVIAKSGAKFVDSKEGKAVVDKALNKFTIYSFVPGLLLGAAAGYWLAKRMK